MARRIYKIEQGVSQSLLKDFLACRVRAEQRILGWTPKKPKTSYRFGTWSHTILQQLYNLIAEGKLKKGDDVAILKLVRGLVDDFVKKEIANPNKRDSEEDVEMEGAMAMALFSEIYLKEWSEDWDRKWVAVEKTFKEKFKGHAFTFLLRGRRDSCFIEKDGLWLLETKTKSQINEEELHLGLSFDFQSLYYLLTLLSMAKRRKLKVKGCLYNIIRKPGLRGKKGESRKELTKRMGEDIRKRPDHYYKRFEIIFPKEVQDRFSKELDLQLEEFRAWLAGDPNIPTFRNPTACMTRFKCDFLEFCASGKHTEYRKTNTVFPELED